jgi:DNA invertase Pin-like site-specific DNA recombinase
MPRTSPGLTEVDKGHIKSLYQLASRYRSTSSPSSAHGRANEELTALVNTLYAQGVTVREIADAAGVTYRAINKRIAREK